MTGTSLATGCNSYMTCSYKTVENPIGIVSFQNRLYPPASNRDARYPISRNVTKTGFWEI